MKQPNLRQVIKNGINITCRWKELSTSIQLQFYLKDPNKIRINNKYIDLGFKKYKEIVFEISLQVSYNNFIKPNPRFNNLFSFFHVSSYLEENVGLSEREDQLAIDFVTYLIKNKYWVDEWAFDLTTRKAPEYFRRLMKYQEFDKLPEMITEYRIERLLR